MEGEKRKTERKGGRERFDLDVWPQQPAGDRDIEGKGEKDRRTEEGGRE